MKGHRKLSKIYKKAAELIATRKSQYCCFAISRAHSLSILDQCQDALETFHEVFKPYDVARSSPYFSTPLCRDHHFPAGNYVPDTEENREHRINALLMLSEMVKDL